MGVVSGFQAMAGVNEARRRSNIYESQANLGWSQLAEQQEEREKRESFSGKAAEYFIKANPDALSKLGMTDQGFANLSSTEKAGMVGGLIQAQAFKQIADQAQREQADIQALEQFRRAIPVGGQPVNVPNPMAPGLFPDYAIAQPATTAADYARLALEKMPPKQWSAFADMARVWSGKEQDEGYFKVGETNFDLPGIPNIKRVPTGRNTSVLVADPSKSNQAVQIISPTGENLGYGLQERGGLKIIDTGQPTAKDEYQSLAREKGILVRELANTFNAKQKKGLMDAIDDLDERMKQLRKQGGGATASPGNPNDPLGLFSQ